MDTRPNKMAKQQEIDFESTNHGEYRDTGSPQYSSEIGEWIGKDARTKLALICLHGFEVELCDKPLSHKSRGRPRSAAKFLSERLGVDRRTVYRWLEGDGVKACDINADRLAEIAYGFDAKETFSVLNKDLENYSIRLSGWLTDRLEANSEASPCLTNRVRAGD